MMYVSINSEREHNSRGFTLVEVMVVMVIIALMGLFAAPELMNIRPNMELNSAAREMYGSFQNCKLRAVRHNTNCVITFNQTVGADTFSYYMFLDTNKNFVPDAGETVLGNANLADHKGIVFDDSQGGGDGLTFIANASGKPAIGFQSIGMPVAPGGSLPSGTAHLKNSKGKLTSIVIGKSGSISIN